MLSLVSLRVMVRVTTPLTRERIKGSLSSLDSVIRMSYSLVKPFVRTYAPFRQNKD